MAFISREPPEKSFWAIKLPKKFPIYISTLDKGTLGDGLAPVEEIEAKTEVFPGVLLLTNTTPIGFGDGGIHVIFFFVQYTQGEPP